MNTVIINFLLAALMLVIIILILVVAIDFFRRKNIKKSLSAQLNQFAVFNELHITARDFPGSRAIGLDPDSKALIFFTPDDKPEIVDLQNIVHCKIKKSFHMRNVQSIQLELQQKNTEKVHLLPFYQKTDGWEFGLSSAMKKAIRWHWMIADHIMAGAENRPISRSK